MGKLLVPGESWVPPQAAQHNMLVVMRKMQHYIAQLHIRLQKVELDLRELRGQSDGEDTGEDIGVGADASGFAASNAPGTG